MQQKQGQKRERKKREHEIRTRAAPWTAEAKASHCQHLWDTGQEGHRRVDSGTPVLCVKLRFSSQHTFTRFGHAQPQGLRLQAPRPEVSTGTSGGRRGGQDDIITHVHYAFWTSAG